MKKRYKPRREHPTDLPRRVKQARPQRQIKYPIATIAQYGPDDKHVTKIAVGIIESEDAEPIMERWLGPDVMTNPEVRFRCWALSKRTAFTRLSSAMACWAAHTRKGLIFR